MSEQPLSKFEDFVERHGVIFFIWVLCLAISWKKTGAQILSGVLPGNDDNMRMAQIRDLLNGQSWTDLHQYRLNPSDPLLSHWSRIGDVIYALPIKLLTPLVGASTAELIAVMLIPALMLLAFFYLLVAITETLIKGRALALIVTSLASLSIFTISQFAFGRIDHHGLQILLALICLWLILHSEDNPTRAAIAGLVAGIGLSIAIESALYVGAACIAICLTWVFNEATARRRMRGFGIALATSTFILLIISSPKQNWFLPYCDANSIVYVALTLMIALVMVLMSAIGTKVHGVLPRLLVAAIMGAMAIGGTLCLFPHCLQGPYAQVDPRLSVLWLANVSEAESIRTVLKNDLFTGTMALVLPIFALGGWLLYNRKEGSGFSLPPRTQIIFVILCTLGGFMQIRVISFSMALSIPLCAFLILYTYRHTKALAKFKKWTLRIGITAIIVPITLPLIISTLFDPDTKEEKDASADNTEKQTCLNAETLRGLRSLTPGFAITQIDLGAPILNHTNLSVSSAPYHRNSAGNLLGFDVFYADSPDAQTHATHAQARYIILCAGDFAETKLLKTQAPDGLASQLIEGEVPTWLTPIPQAEDSELLVYEIHSRKNSN